MMYTLPKGGTYEIQIGNDKQIVTLPSGYEIRMDYSDGILNTGCSHEWINVGFHFDKIVCKKCDCEKK